LPKTPWWRGSKDKISGVFRQARFPYDGLSTALVEVEAVINSHPLSYVTADDFEEPLTLSHLL